MVLLQGMPLRMPGWRRWESFTCSAGLRCCSHLRNSRARSRKWQRCMETVQYCLSSTPPTAPSSRGISLSEPKSEGLKHTVQYSTDSTVLYCTVLYCTVCPQHDALLFRHAAYCRASQSMRGLHHTVQYSKLQYNTVHCSTVQYSAVQYSRVLNCFWHCSLILHRSACCKRMKFVLWKRQTRTFANL